MTKRPRRNLIDNSGDSMTKEISRVKVRVTNLEAFKEKAEKFNYDCEQQHTQHFQYRRESDNKMVGVYAVLTEMNDTIKDIAKEYKQDREVIKRSRDNYTAYDVVLKRCGEFSIVSAVVVAIYLGVQFLQG